MDVVFFLRHYNDIDHIVPIIAEGVRTGAFDAEVVLATDESYLEDYRLQHVAQLDGATVSHIEAHGVPSIGSSTSSIATTTATVKEVGRRLPTDLPQRVWNRLSVDEQESSVPDASGIESLVDRLATAERTVIAVDWLTTSASQSQLGFVEELSRISEALETPFVALPHGDAPYQNKLFKKNSLDLDSVLDQYRTGRLFNNVVVSNRLCARRYRPHLPDSRIHILGSPRYNERWLTTLSGLLPEQEYPSSSELDIVWFLRDTNYAIDWAELGRTVDMIASIEGVRLILKYHTRGISEELEHPDLPNVDLVGDEIHSPVLLDWADVAMDLGTSVVFEAVVREIPVLEVEYLHPNRSTVASHLDETAMHTRDDIFHAVRRLTDDTSEFFDSSHRDSFIRNVIEPAGSDVLSQYVDFLSTVESE